MSDIKKKHSIKPLYLIADQDMKRRGKVKFEVADDLWQVAFAYFKWADSEDLYESKTVISNGEAEVVYVPKSRPFSLDGFFVHARLCQSTFSDYSQIDEFKEVAETIKNIIRTQKFDGAAAGIFNATVIIRDLGLTDSTSNAIFTPEGESVTFTTIPIGRDGKDPRQSNGEE